MKYRGELRALVNPYFPEYNIHEYSEYYETEKGKQGYLKACQWNGSIKHYTITFYDDTLKETDDKYFQRAIITEIPFTEELEKKFMYVLLEGRSKIYL